MNEAKYRAAERRYAKLGDAFNEAFHGLRGHDDAGQRAGNAECRQDWIDDAAVAGRIVIINPIERPADVLVALVDFLAATVHAGSQRGVSQS